MIRTALPGRLTMITKHPFGNPDDQTITIARDGKHVRLHGWLRKVTGYHDKQILHSRARSLTEAFTVPGARLIVIGDSDRLLTSVIERFRIKEAVERADDGEHPYDDLALTQELQATVWTRGSIYEVFVEE